MTTLKVQSATDPEQNKPAPEPTTGVASKPTYKKRGMSNGIRPISVKLIGCSDSDGFQSMSAFGAHP